ncbi:MAG: hypothetical protein GXP49_02970, partial [Deltaproteobacteria bacterium]|nr:hypothetical protein [Deltaproteobacteria bacterium]
MNYLRIVNRFNKYDNIVDELSFNVQIQIMNDFAIKIYLEALEEASFLYEQRLGLFDDPEITWLDVEDLEER